MNKEIPEIQSLFLKQELARRCQRNARYSQRSFAETLGISNTYLILLLEQKRKLSTAKAEKIAEKLCLPPAKKQEFLGNKVLAPQEKINQAEEIEMDQFAHFSEWQNYAILSLMNIPNFIINSKNISKRLGISEVMAKLAIDRLLRLGIIYRDGDKFKRGKPIKFENEVASSATRKFQRQLLDKAVESLEERDMDEREISSMTLAMSSKLIPYARKKIREFRRELTAELESMETPDEVYNLTVQICPVSKKGEV